MHRSLIIQANMGRVFLAVLTIGLCPLTAGADGCFIWNKGVDINEPSQKAIILYDKGQEDLILQVRYEGPAEEFGWLIPVPGKPTVEKASIECFYELSLMIQRRGRKLGGQDAVVVLEIKTVGNYDVAVLAATDADALAGWLTKHKFNWPKKHRGVLDHYVKKKWFFVAVKINLEKADSAARELLRKGELHPLKITFDSPQCVYPLKISSVNKGFSDVDIYVFGTDRLACEVMDFFTDTRSDRVFYDYSFPRCAKDLPRIKGKKWYLVKHSRRFFPEVMDDLTFSPHDDKKWKQAQAAYLRDYFVKNRKSFLAELEAYQKELGYKELSGHWRQGASRTPWEIDRIKRFMKIVAELTPDIQEDLALTLLEQEQFNLMQLLLAAPPQASADVLAASLAQKILDAGPRSRRFIRRGHYYDIRSTLAELLRRLGPKGKDGTAMLATAFLKIDKNSPAIFPLTAAELGALIQCNPNEQVSTRMLQFLKSPDYQGRHYAIWYFALVRYEPAVEPLIGLLDINEKSRIQPDLLIDALGTSKDKRAVEPLLKYKYKRPKRVFAALRLIDEETARSQALAWVGTEGPARTFAIYYLRYPGYEPNADQRKEAVAALVKIAGQVSGHDIYRTAEALVFNCCKGDRWLAEGIAGMKALLESAQKQDNMKDRYVNYVRKRLDRLQNDPRTPAPATQPVK